MPPYITCMLTVNNGLYQSRSSDFITFQVPQAFTELDKSAFNYRAVESWNMVQDTLKLDSFGLTRAFKILLSTFILFVVILHYAEIRSPFKLFSCQNSLFTNTLDKE